MTQLIIHPGTATILRPEECVILDIDELSPEDAAAVWSALEEGLDMEIVAIADREGSPIMREI